MITLPELDGRHVRLEPLQRRHAAGLAAAAAADPSLYRLTPVPQGQAAAAGYIETALVQRDAGSTVPFAVVRADDGAVIGSTRFFDLQWWPWPPDHPRRLRGDGPDTCEIGYTWLTAAAIGTAANTEMKLLMLRYAFETWQVASVCLHTDARNERSRRAMERIGAQFEGILRAHRLATDGTPRDSARYSVTAPDWPGVERRLQERLAAREEQSLFHARLGGPHTLDPRSAHEKGSVAPLS
jgi:RimJ/RimL family protein N-acetyltransferase